MKLTKTRKVGIKHMKPKSPLGRSYDTEGRVHIFEYDMEKKDYLCKVCGIWKSESAKIDETVIQTAISRKNRKNAFFQVFENNCPVEGVHNFVGDTCKKCNIKFGEQSSEYYEKYKSKMKPIRRIFAHTRQNPAPISNEFDKLFADWKFNFNVVNNLANLLKVSVKLLSSLGDYDKNNYDKILSGEYIAAIPSNSRNVRSIIIKSYLRMVIIEYNQIRFSHTKTNILKPLTTLIEESGVPPQKLEEMLPSIYAQQFEMIEYFQQYKSPQESFEFALEQLCSLITTIYKKDDNLMRNFAIYITEKILRGSYLRTKNNYFNFSIVYGEKKETTTQASDNFAETVDEEGDENPFSLDAFDVEEPGDDEDTPNLIKTTID